MNELITVGGNAVDLAFITQCTNEDFLPKVGQTNHYTLASDGDDFGLFKCCMTEPNGMNDCCILNFDDTLIVKVTVEDGKIVAYLTSDGEHWHRHPDNFQLLDIDASCARFIALLNPVWKMFFLTPVLENPDSYAI